VYLLVGNYTAAEECLEEAREAQKRRTESENDRSTASTLGNLAALYRATGRYAEAEPLYRRTSDIARGSLGEDDPYYARACLQS
jgi:tetratricopeptide (TPR) repeat protein